MKKEKTIKGFFITLMLRPNVYILIISLSLNNFIKVIDSPITTIKGRIIVKRLGIKYIDKIKIDIVSICNKFDSDISLVNCNNQAIDIKIKKIREKPFINSKNI